MATSTISLLAGLLIASGYSSRLLVRVVVKKVRGRKYLPQVENETEEDDVAVTQDEMSSETQEVAPDEEEISLFEELGDNARIEFSSSVQVQASGPGEEVEQDGSDAGYFEPGTSHSEEMDSAKFKESFRTQAEDYDRERGQFESFAEHPSQAATLMSTEPVARNLSDLTQEVSAIREFASQQQDHVRRLQDGYDWNIIKRFCLRVIRCIDNLDDRINKLTEEEIEFQGLEDVRDELIFALESSGVEQFEPELGSNYKGQEKYLEAVKERSETEDADLSGKIAEVVRFGYKYVISDDEVRFVRSAQVKLYV
jgi:molecular chaperone GrpE (heat shock protein)